MEKISENLILVTSCPECGGGFWDTSKTYPKGTLFCMYCGRPLWNESRDEE